jgi:uncharacterized membrane-anchored protein
MNPLSLPPELPQRQRLADEVHARPFESLSSPGAVLSVATLREDAALDLECLAHLARLEGLADNLPATGSGQAAPTHLLLHWGGLRIKWERHTEFYSFAFFTDTAPGELPQAFDTSWLDVLPPGWLAGLPGKTIAATHVALLLCAGEPPPHVRHVAPVFGSEILVGNRIVDDAATMVTDLRSVGGVTRFLVFDHSLNRRRAGRVAQRLIEIDTYRMMALLSLPVASRRMSELGQEEDELASLIKRFRNAQDRDDHLLDELTALATRVEHAVADNGARFSATQAYRDIVDRRLGELKEGVVPGLQPLSEFLARRFRPAMDSTAAAAARQWQLSVRISRAAQLLQTRTDVAREKQNLSVLESMNRRQGLQLRLQETVEGLSVIAMTYYGVGIAGYVLKPLAKALGWNDAVVTMVAVPVIALAVLVSMRRFRKRLNHRHGEL